MKKALLLLPLLFLVGCSNNSPSSKQVIVEPDPIEIEATNEYTKEDVTLYKESQKLVGEFYIPSNSYDVFPVLVVSHGFANSMDNTRSDALEFVKQGFAAFIFDFIGGGYSIKSDGQMTEMSVLTEAADLNIVVDYLLTREEVDEDHIYLMGQSQGGFVSTYVACTRDDIRGLVCFYPAYCIADDAFEQYDSLDKVPDTYSVLGFATVGKIYYKDATSFDIYELMPNYDHDVLIIHGTADDIVPYKYAVRASETFNSAELMTIQNGGHGFSGQDRTNAINKSVDYLLEHL